MISVQSTGDRSPNQVVPLEVQILEAARGWALAHPPRPPGLVNNRAPHVGSGNCLSHWPHLLVHGKSRGILLDAAVPSVRQELR